MTYITEDFLEELLEIFCNLVTIDSSLKCKI